MEGWHSHSALPQWANSGWEHTPALCTVPHRFGPTGRQSSQMPCTASYAFCNIQDSTSKHTHYMEPKAGCGVVSNQFQWGHNSKCLPLVKSTGWNVKLDGQKKKKPVIPGLCSKYFYLLR